MCLVCEDNVKKLDIKQTAENDRVVTNPAAAITSVYQYFISIAYNFSTFFHKKFKRSFIAYSIGHFLHFKFKLVTTLQLILQPGKRV